MLKLEKTSRDHDVSVAFCSKEHFFTRPLLTALAVALGIHLGFIILFQVSPLKIRWDNTPILPSIVETELLPPGENLVMAKIDLEALPDNILTKAPPPLPFLADLPLFLPNRHIEFKGQAQALTTLFTEIEKEIYLPSFSQAGSPSLGPLSVHISGPLANKKLINDHLQKYPTNIFSELNTKAPQRLLYSVLVDEQSGSVFWHELVEKGVNEAMEKMGSGIIYGLEFAKMPSAFVTAGQIELYFNPEFELDNGIL